MNIVYFFFMKQECSSFLFFETLVIEYFIHIFIDKCFGGVNADTSFRIGKYIN